MKIRTGLVIVLIVLNSCSRQGAKYFDLLVFVTFSSESNTSFKISSSDTLFREIKYPRHTVYTYKILNVDEKEKLNDLANNLQKQQMPESSFSIGLNQSVVFIDDGISMSHYTSQLSRKKSSYNNLIQWFDRLSKSEGFKIIVTNFWNIDGIHV